MMSGIEIMKLEKLITGNSLLQCAVGTTVAEYDIAAAAPTACRFIMGEQVYRDLMALPKLERNILTGKMQQDDPTLWKKIEAITLGWFNEFLETNKIDNINFVETTRDSILVVGKIPQKLEFQSGKVVFRVKDNEGPWSSFYRIDGKLILMDSMKNEIRIKGITKEYTEASYFIQSFMKPLLSSIETAQSGGLTQLLKILAKYRDKYIDAKKVDMYREINTKNQYRHCIDGDVIYSDTLLSEETLEKSGNYVDYFMPILRSVMN